MQSLTQCTVNPLTVQPRPPHNVHAHPSSIGPVPHGLVSHIWMNAPDARSTQTSPAAHVALPHITSVHGMALRLQPLAPQSAVMAPVAPAPQSR